MKYGYHLVLVTKYRKKWGVELLEFNGEADHVHLLLDMHPNIMPSKFINNLKTVTSRLMRKEFAKHLAHFYWKPVLWTRAYCLLTTGGATIDTIRQYIEKQERPD
ncbi:IS200/IS605 family transposase [Moraxella caprae]|uniref:IS200/IS605 family transposase n=1 Tax=Moraxella caprae TaxID=90240 RepID=UPI0009FC5574